MTDVLELEPEPIEIDPRPCELCGCTIDQHERVDTPEGPEFFCDDVERQIYLDASLMRLCWELADPRDVWKHTGEPPPQASDIPTTAKPSYSAPQSTIDAFLFVAGLGDADYLARWLDQHPLDAPVLHRLWEDKNARA
jgi:hypothetical protein